MTREQALAAARAIDAEYLSHVSLYARQSENGINNPHLRWMVEQMADMSENKTQRWLGYLQGVLVAQGRATLADMKDINRRAISTSDRVSEK